jgi:CheY-like chemotaxis protein
MQRNRMTPKQGPIVLVEDDGDDQELIADALKAAGVSNELRIFENGKEVLQYLYDTNEQPLIILCDINMPIMDGLQLRRHIQSDDYLRLKSIPFVFLSTDASPAAVKEAYELTVQGFFKKPTRFQRFEEMLKLIIDYWCMCKHVNN